MEMGILFDHIIRVGRRESPLTPIRRHLENDKRYVKTDETCPDPQCDGMLWDGRDDKVCGQCSIVKDESRSIDNRNDLWAEFWDNRPRYRNSNHQRQVGGFDHEWVESDDVEGPIAELNPTFFYRPEDHR